MKKLFIISLFAFVALALSAQERTVNLNEQVYNNKVLNLATASPAKLIYNGGTSDVLLYTTRDTIDFIVSVTAPVGPIRMYSVLTFAPLTTADTTVSVTVQEKKFGSESYTDLISAATTGAITTSTQYVRTTLGVSSDYSTNVPNVLLFYNQIRVRCIIRGDDHTGTGIKITKFEIQFWM
jgi:hypothetical protein